jgi:predicted DNA-binding protein YlxM (UPF0122 family)
MVNTASDISDDDNHSDMSLDRSKEIADEVISIASSAASMERKTLENRVIQLEKQLVLAKKTNRNKSLHDKVLKETANIAPVIMQMDLCTLWWVSQWIEERKARLGKTDTNGDNQKLLRAYKDWGFRTKAKLQAGMTHSKVTPFSPAKGAASGSD